MVLMLVRRYDMTYNWNIIVMYVLMYFVTLCVASWYDICTPSTTGTIHLLLHMKYSTWSFWNVKNLVNNQTSQFLELTMYSTHANILRCRKYYITKQKYNIDSPLEKSDHPKLDTFEYLDGGRLDKCRSMIESL